MRRANTVVIALMLGAAVAFGSFAALKTARVGTATARPARAPAWKIAKRRSALNRMEKSLRVALRKHPPKLQKVPKFAPVKTPPAAPAPVPVAAPAAPPAAPATRPTVIQYVRPKPIVITKHRSGGDDQGESEDHHSEREGSDD